MQFHDRLHTLIHQQRQFFNTGETKEIHFQITQLKALRHAILDHEKMILDALKADLNKSEYEAYGTEIRVVNAEINHAIKHIRSWAKPKYVSTPLEQFPVRAKICPEPLGVVLILAPWNYPFQLTIAPLVGAIAAGNCVLLKPSELAPHTSHAIAELIQSTFDSAYITVIEGGVEVSQIILEEKFDHIFFTGGTAIGKRVMSAAAQHLTPVTLELGGKSPCIVDIDIDVDCTARRIVWGKFLNAGQSCVAPDYILVDRRIKSALIPAMQTAIQSFFGIDPAQSPDYARIISDRHFSRLVNLMQNGNVLIGGETKPDERYIAPTLLDQGSLDDPIMQEEIFGPILPLIEYESIEDTIALITARPKPLALYLFTRNPQLQQRIQHATSSGSFCINETMMHLAIPDLPFGGIGESGIGSYHGKAGFDTFSHRKSVLSKPFWLDVFLRYPPYEGKLAIVRRLFG
ncbi:MAG: aldehyde dehydrogenase [Cyanobacteria bacterium CRU_2_1]|nr:aldehyde dehydrogenase [Cyanobacteria bacterium RU_5_0]NJR62202.1 aldehyde dehydrogenase [Cyanobacteria bacterium CRU_2_1]